MKLRRHACLWLSLAVVACDKPEASSSPHREDPPPARITRPLERPPRESGPIASNDFRAALANAVEIPSPAAREKAIEKVAWDAIELDPELAREAMEKLTPDSDGRIRLLQHLAMRMAEENVNEALEWAATLGTEQERAGAYGHIALVASDTDPARAANLLSESGIAGHAFDVVAVQVLGRWAAKSPADAAAWAALFPPGASREAGIRTVVSSWAATDAAAAFSWMDAIQDEAVRRESVAAMAAALLRQPRERRDEWLGHAGPNVRAAIEAEWETTKKETGNPTRPPVD